jgi:carboxyl-terminal processing protease
MDQIEGTGNRVKLIRRIGIFLIFLVFLGLGRAIARGKYRDLGLALYVIPVVRYYYIEPVPFPRLLGSYIRSGSIRGMLASLGDPYTRYLNKDEYNELKTQTEGTYGGVGFYTYFKDDQITIMRPIKNTPAERAGLRAGDRILAINGESTAGMALEVAVAKIKGPPGTKVTLTIERGESERRRKETVELTRALILIPSVEWQVEEDPVAGRIGRVNILQFNEKTPEDLRKALDSLAGEEVSGLLLDLRYNPGGLLTAAVETAGCFTGEKPVVHVTQRGKKVKTYSGPSGKRWELPLVVMVNEWSASGAEILAGALKDYGIGTLVGRRTFGKGVVQDVIPLANGGAVTLTVAGYLTAGGHSIHGTGIEPNVIPEIDENLQKAVEGGDIEALEKADARTEEKAREVLREKILQARRAKRAAWRGEETAGWCREKAAA